MLVIEVEEIKKMKLKGKYNIYIYIYITERIELSSWIGDELLFFSIKIVFLFFKKKKIISSI